MRHLIDLDAMPMNELDELLHFAGRIMDKPEYYFDSCHGRLMATLFYEPSTRTQMSFQAAMLKLGGRVIGFDNPSNTSVSKGESLKDTIRVVSNYTDIITVRHPLEGSAKASAMFSRVPVINAGDGGHLHPTQTLTDLFTLQKTKGTLKGMTIGFCGDLRNGRTVHSLIKALIKYKTNRFVLISTENLMLPSYIQRAIERAGCEYTCCNNLAEALPELDVLYMTRIQKERFASPEEYEAQKGVYVLNREKLKNAKYGLKVLHPLPRVDEIALDVDDDPAAVYFDQTEYGMYVRMALILNMLDGSRKFIDPQRESNSKKGCTNPRCITISEAYLPHLLSRADGKIVCEFCDHEQQ